MTLVVTFVWICIFLFIPWLRQTTINYIVVPYYFYLCNTTTNASQHQCCRRCHREGVLKSDQRLKAPLRDIRRNSGLAKKVNNGQRDKWWPNFTTKIRCLLRENWDFYVGSMNSELLRLATLSWRDGIREGWEGELPRAEPHRVECCDETVIRMAASAAVLSEMAHTSSESEAGGKVTVECPEEQAKSIKRDLLWDTGKKSI